MTLTRASLAPPARTLIDIFRQTVADHPEALAVDNGAEMLTYEEFADAADEVAATLNAMGVGRGDRVGVRIRSGTVDLYVAIMGVLAAGAAYVPVDADDPDERARLVFGEAAVAAIVGNGLVVADRGHVNEPRTPEDPTPADDAWIIFTSGSTGTPKGVAVSHRSAAAFVDAESRMFLQREPLGPADRVMAGLSVAFDASCEEMWLAWAHGGCLVPAPRSLVRSGVDVGPWLVANDVTVVSTVPTLVALWPTESLDAVRLLIMGGEACPPEIGTRLARPDRELWNTYGPTEATVVACGAQLDGNEPVRIGLPLDGWDLAVVDDAGEHVQPGEIGELIIGGVGLARYLDPDKDAEKYAPFPTLGWERAYRSGDRVVYDEQGLLFAGRGDDQVKLGGRRIELGEIDNALLALPGVTSAAAAVRRAVRATSCSSATSPPRTASTPPGPSSTSAQSMPAALVPRLAEVPSLPTMTSGKVDRDALPWPLATDETHHRKAAELHGTAAWIAELWLEVVGAVVTDEGDDFFDLGGGSLTAAQMVSRLRARYPEVTVADLYENPTVRALATMLDEMTAPTRRAPTATSGRPRRRPRSARSSSPSRCGCSPACAGSPGWSPAATSPSSVLGLDFLPTFSWWWVAGRLGPAGLRARPDGAVGPRRADPAAQGDARRLPARWHASTCGSGWPNGSPTSSAPPTSPGRRGCRRTPEPSGPRSASSVDLHSIPPVTGMLTLGSGCSVEPEVDLSGHWLDGDVLHIGRIKVGAGARVGTRSTLAPGSVVGRDAEVAPGSAVVGSVTKGEYWTGSPAEPVGRTRGPW